MVTQKQLLNQGFIKTTDKSGNTVFILKEKTTRGFAKSKRVPEFDKRVVTFNKIGQVTQDVTNKLFKGRNALAVNRKTFVDGKLQRESRFQRDKRGRVNTSSHSNLSEGTIKSVDSRSARKQRDARLSSNTKIISSQDAARLQNARFKAQEKAKQVTAFGPQQLNNQPQNNNSTPFGPQQLDMGPKQLDPNGVRGGVIGSGSTIEYAKPQGPSQLRTIRKEPKNFLQRLKFNYDDTKALANSPGTVASAPTQLALFAPAGSSVVGLVNKVQKSGAIGTTAVGAVRTYAVGKVTLKTVEEVGAATRSKEDKAIIRKIGVDNFEKLTGDAFAAQRKQARSEGFIAGFGDEVSPLLTSKKSKQAFTDSIKQSSSDLGLTEKQTERLVSTGSRRRTTAGVGEGIAFLAQSASTEILGRQLLADKFAKASTVPASLSFLGGFKKTAPSLFLAGASEGATQELISQDARNRQFSGKSVAIESLFGGVSAATIGGAIGGLAATKGKGARVARATLQSTANIADPFEKPGDILADVAVQGSSRLTGSPFKVPTFTFTPGTNDVTFETATFSPVNTNTRTTTKVQSTTKQSTKRSVVQPVNSKSIVPSLNTPVTVPTPTRDIVTSPFNKRRGGSSIVPTNSRSNPIVSSPINSNPIVPTQAPVNPIVPVNTRQDTIVTNTPVNPFSFVPVVTAPGFPPLNFPDSGGSGSRGFGGFGRRQKGKFKPSVLGLDIFRRTGKTQKETKFVLGAGIRLPTEKQAKKLRKNPLNLRF